MMRLIMLGKATLLQLTFPLGKRLEFPVGKIPSWNNKVVKILNHTHKSLPFIFD